MLKVRMKGKQNLVKRCSAIANPERAWRINSFKQLGLTDPFTPTMTFDSTLNFLLALDFETPVYPLLPSPSPGCIFIPTTSLL